MSWGEDALEIAERNEQITLPPEAIEYLASKGKGKSKNKFNAVHCEFNGIKFASKAEMRRYGDLRLLELTGAITDLATQPVFTLTAGIKYRGDFLYVEKGKTICEDIKGGKATATRTFLNKWKQAKFLYPDIEFRLIET